MNQAQLHLENDMLDNIGRMYNKLGEEGYHGGYVDSQTEEFEAEFHKLYYWAIAGSARFSDFKSKLKEFYYYYQTKAKKKEANV